MAFWRGTWDYANIWYDDFIFKKDYDLSNGVALLLGLLLNFLLDMFHHCVRPLAGEVRRVKTQYFYYHSPLLISPDRLSEALDSEDSLQLAVRNSGHFSLEGAIIYQLR